MDVYLSLRKTRAMDSPQVPGSSPKTKCRALKVDHYNYQPTKKKPWSKSDKATGLQRNLTPELSSL